jgi:flavodoxin
VDLIFLKKPQGMWQRKVMRNNMKKLLIVYYSWTNGNTERIARKLKKVSGADMARIETVIPYSGSYDEVVKQGQDEVNRGYQPEIVPLPVSVKDYDVIAVGTPTWWYTMAPAVLSFVKTQDFNGKTVIPFMTNGGWPGHVIRDIKRECAGADFLYEMEVKFDSSGGDHLETSETDIDAWAESVADFIKEENA